ncbi:MAG: TolB family protein [Streptosporangiaceae bacterium]
MGAAVVAVLIVAEIQHGGEPSASSTSTPTPTRSVSSPDGQSATPSATSSPVTVTKVGHRLLGVTAGWELFGRGPDEVVRIQLARGRITRTKVPYLDSGGPVSFLVGPDRAVIRPWDSVPGYAVPDGERAHKLRGALGHGGPVIPGPKPGQVWVWAQRETRQKMSLVGLHGSKTGVSIALPAGAGWAVSDGGGYPLVTATGGVYDMRSDGPHRVTTGRVTAVGPTGWLAIECDDRHRCTRVVIERASGARHELPGHVADRRSRLGSISPDGSTAAVFRVRGAGEITLHLVDLASGADHRLAVSLEQGQGAPFPAGSLAWSPDSRWLFVANGKNLFAVYARTGHVRGVRVKLPQIDQVAVRSAPR